MELSSFPIIGIALAVLSAALLTVGNHLQSVGVERAKGASTSGLGAAGFWALARTPVWLLGSVLFGLAILAQLTALAFAPLIVVQPVGVIALVFSVWLIIRAHCLDTQIAPFSCGIVCFRFAFYINQ